MTDNGAAMKAEELTSGLHELGILHEATLPYSPYHYVAATIMCCSGWSHAGSMVDWPQNST
jgi:hypothetical protein